MNFWSAYIQNNSISSVNLGIFVRGIRSTGNRITQNLVVGGATAANNLLGICYNPEGGGAGPEGPRGAAVEIARDGDLTLATWAQEEQTLLLISHESPELILELVG